MMKGMGRCFGVAGLLASTALCLVAVHPAFAQEAAKPDPRQERDVDEIIVTANKRSEPVRKISGSITAQSEEKLEELGASGFSDYLTLTPGVVFNAATPGQSNITIRGVSTTTGQDVGQATTAIFINDVPLSDPTLSIGTPDIDTFDVNNVSILRGPQGTLFGSGSLGGAVNYEANKPDLQSWDAHLQSSVESVDHGDQGAAGKVMINIPIIPDVLAVRGVFVERSDAGFIDNVGTGSNNSNRVHLTSGRALVTWKPGPDTTVNYMFLRQQENLADDGYEEPFIAGTYKKNTFAPEYSDSGTLVHNLRIDQDVGFGVVTGTASYHEKTLSTMSDLTAALSSSLFGLSQIGSLGGAKAFGETYELRLASKEGGRFDYVVGAFYDQTHMNQSQIITAPGLDDVIDSAYGPGTGAAIAPGNLVVNASLPADAKDMALFGEGTYHLTDQWKLTAGGRLFYQSLTNGSDGTGLIAYLNTGAPTSDQSGSQSARGFNPKVSLTWTPTDDVLAYALVSKGFRFGGANLLPPLTASPIPSEYKSDSLWNYEVGVRTDWLDKRLKVDVNAFYIDWSDIQLHLTYNSINYANNAGGAKIYGVESATTFKVAHGLDFSNNVTWLDARLSQAFNPDPSDPASVIVPSGTSLPGASAWQVSNTMSYRWDSSLAPFVLVSQRYISRAESQLQDTIMQGGYNLFDVRAGVQLDDVGITAYAQNLGNVHGVTTSVDDPLHQYLVRPRTIGLTLDWRL